MVDPQDRRPASQRFHHGGQNRSTLRRLSEKTLMEIGETLLIHTAAEWREWLALHHSTKKEIWLVYYKKTSGKTGIIYEESVEQALCFGWIDGAIKGIDAETYAGRFTPRRAKSPWSESNRARVARLVRDGLMMEAGIAVLPDDLRATGTLRQRNIHDKIAGKSESLRGRDFVAAGDTEQIN